MPLKRMDKFRYPEYNAVHLVLRIGLKALYPLNHKVLENVKKIIL
jgi:hypothetical protein